ncbi:hypothetical protein [Legionella maioricensis]|uniref:Uncharacterized protein n=1 Tax=Legionella maioricensis TaxID=2896528 RepID=A0A9X2D295_9GAMM|nr:hypothetical protein [Legionella maioricensis]MCL9684989.1 hypothetical protein [Legionella maioricensis]MCL9688114.1 hypothetical protein [Legionella maioricensis]
MKRWAFADMLAVDRTLLAKIHKQKRFASPNNNVHFMAFEMDDWLVKGILRRISNYLQYMPDAQSLPAMQRLHPNLLGVDVLQSVATDKEYYSYDKYYPKNAIKSAAKSVLMMETCA